MVQIHMIGGVEMVTAEDYHKMADEFLGEAKKTSELLTKFLEQYGPKDVSDVGEPNPFEVLISRSDDDKLLVDHMPDWYNKAVDNHLVGKSHEESCFLVITPYGMKMARPGDKIKFDENKSGLQVLYDGQDKPSINGNGGVERNDNAVRILSVDGKLMPNHSPEWFHDGVNSDRIGTNVNGKYFLVMTPRGLERARKGDIIGIDTNGWYYVTRNSAVESVV